MQSLEYFSTQPFINALKAFFKELNIPINYIADEPATPGVILGDKWKHNIEAHALIDEVYALGMVNDAIFEGRETYQDLEEIRKFDKDYDGLLIFGVTLKERRDNLPITRSQLAEITRAFNRAFPYTPVTIVFKYSHFISFANSERIPYKDKSKAGEKVGKVTILRDINLLDPHRGHLDILENLNIEKKWRKTIQNFSDLYAYWQEVFSVNVLNKKFYQELSNWYFWAVKHVTFPSKPNQEDAYKKNAKLEDLIQEHNATNVIRLLTRLLFTWFIKEKKLIPDELFELDVLQKEILKDIEPYHENGLFVESNKESIYYKAILQNLFFATLNCPINSDSVDKRNRRFRLNNFYGQDRGNDWLYKYENHFKDSEAFLKLMNNCVPFLNGGLFECLDDKTKNLYIDGFSDNMTKGEQLIVPDYLFFGIVEHIDLSAEYGVNNSSTQKAAVKGLINILRSYKFTITENTPIEEDVALDPELLGKVFENLLASYNPETKTTARKQTGSFYTPREIVSYMVDESLIAYLKTNVKEWNLDENELDEQLHQLISYDTFNPFEERENLTKEIIHALDKCKILDPACGSGAFPMGALQKMVHVLQKLDPENRIWKEIQLKKVQEETNEVFLNIEDKTEREDKLKEINNAFDQKINDPDYARKLYLIENSIYGVDIQPIAIQISKLRFFISLVVDQKNSHNPNENFGIRPLPNLETKFVAANTLIGIEKPSAQLSMYNSDIIKTLETELKLTRSKLFGARSKETKLKHRKRDEELRNAIAIELEKSGWGSDVAQKLAGWDPYDQNSSSSFFDPEWMFNIPGGFDVVIGNPPYKVLSSSEELLDTYKTKYKVTLGGKVNLYKLFFEKGFQLLNKAGALSYITPYNYLTSGDSYELRKLLIYNTSILEIIDYEEDKRVFENVTQAVATIVLVKGSKDDTVIKYLKNNQLFYISTKQVKTNKKLLLKGTNESISKILNLSNIIADYVIGFQGEINVSIKKDLFTNIKSIGQFPLVRGNSISLYELKESPSEYCHFSGSNRDHHNRERIIFQEVSNSGLKKRVKAVILCDVLCGHTTNYIISKSDSNNWFFLGIINSSLLNYYFKFFNQTNHVPIGEIMGTPIPDLKSHPKQTYYIGVLAKLINKNFQSTIFNVIDSLVFNLYFPDHMQEREIDVLQFVEQDLEKVMQGREFDSLSTEEKEDVIKKLHEIWSNPDNEVIKRINLFKEKSPDILKPILES